MKPKRKSDVAVGMYVTITEDREAYYSRYAGRPMCVFRPGMVGIVRSVDVPYVTDWYKKDGRSPTFCRVDFYVEGVDHDKAGNPWSVDVDYKRLHLFPDTPNICTRQFHGVTYPVNPHWNTFHEQA